MVYKKKQGSRIQTILNGIKRPINVASKELNVSYENLHRIVNGETSNDELMDIIHLIVARYPIRISDILIEEDTTDNGITYCSKEESENNSRIIRRINRENNLTDFYNYFDCAINKNMPFKPELIKMLRTVNDNDPNNPDVAYNRGHLESQLTFYIGNVNFYYSVDGINYCISTETGD